MTDTNRYFKRLFDIIFSFFGLIVFLPIIFFAWVIATLETRSNGFFIQSRVGLNGYFFKIIKIKTMTQTHKFSTSVTKKNDNRITKSGVFFRRKKIDELPQLWNIFIGDMSFVGPRPDVPGYADKLSGNDRIILTIRPGITGPASIKYKNEEELLESQKSPEDYNRNVIWPDKVNINKAYIKNYSFIKDIKYIWQTVVG
jgi:lipopolysaccharide/colanic/teichoic acid biosynthesis glycosyltransferase